MRRRRFFVPAAFGLLGLIYLASTAEARPEITTCKDARSCKVMCDQKSVQDYKRGAACTKLGFMYSGGELVEPSKKKAAKLFERACNLRYSWACWELSKLYKDGWMFEVPRRVKKAERLRDRALSYASLGCQRKQWRECRTQAEIDMEKLRKDNWPKDDKTKKWVTEQLVPRARKACVQGKSVTNCKWLHRNASALRWSGRYIDRAKMNSLRRTAEAQFQSACNNGNVQGCLLAVRQSKYRDPKKAKKFAAIACQAGNKRGCFEQAVIGFRPDPKNKAETAKRVAKILQTCELGEHAECGEIVEVYLRGLPQLGIEKDVAKGMRLLENMCMRGNARACAGVAYVKRRYKKAKIDRGQAIRLLERSCKLTPFKRSCALCSKHWEPNNRQCLLRQAWRTRTKCEDGDDQECESLGDMYMKGRGVSSSLNNAATYYRRACDAAVKSACVRLDDMCVKEQGRKKSALDKDKCHQSLIHSDFFYEAEWQFRQTGKMTIRDGEKKDKAANIPGVSVAAQASAGGGLKLQRGSINADLVVSIVLDRARQAAIRLVVDELKRRGKGNVPRYLADLLTQAALLLADQSTLRREKFHDLAMTVVRAFIASNALRTLYSDTDALVRSEIWNVLDNGKWVASSFKEGERLRGYLTDWAYYLLGETKMFGRVAGTQRTIPRCVFKSAQGKKVCGWMVTADGRPNRGTLEKVLRVNGVLQALQLAKLVKEQGGVDLRRFIEALGKARSIADLSKTPGLDLRKWDSEIIASFQTKLADLKLEGEALRDLLDYRTYRGKINWAEVERKAAATARLIVRKEVRSRLDSSALTQIRSIIRLINDKPRVRVRPGGGGGLGGGGISAGPTTPGGAGVAVDVKVEVDPRIAKINAVLRGWRDIWTFRHRGIGAVLKSIDEASKPLKELSRKIVELRAIMRRYNRGKNLMRIDSIPLHGLQDLRQQFEAAVKDLAQAEIALRKVFPGKVGPKVRFAQSAAIRLISFFNLMDRVARKVSHSQSLQDITKALSLLGSVRDAKFSAPLFDVMEPVLHALKTHKPMDADVLFAIIAKVRLDSLITTLATKAKAPCQKKEGGTECWTVKVIHALQESIEKQGDMIRIDGGKFAKRLARHGDDFRRRHKGGTFFHLTIGFGGMYSQDPPTADGTGTGKARWVPVIGEQIGFGWATPTFWHERLTAKFGIFASGILYRMLLDSSESEAVMLSPFFAIDVYDLVELYAAPSLLIYPPIGDRSIGAKFGFSAGLTVPLGAYLEKL